MFKFGISSAKQLVPAHLDGFFKSRKFIALDLYNSLDQHSAAERDKIQERILCLFSNQNGTVRYTHNHRFDEFDTLAVSNIVSTCGTKRIIRVHDVGASDGRTSCDLYNRLNQIYSADLSFFASDYAPYLYILRRRGSANRLIVDAQDSVLQIIAPPFVFNVVRRESKVFYPLNHLIHLLVRRFYAEPLLATYKAGDADIDRVRLDLLCKECRSNLASNSNFHFDSYDIFKEPTEPFDVVRAMNILNRDYFSEERLRKAIENIALSLNAGGLFITGSNTEAGTTVNGGIYQKRGDRFERLGASGSGSQVDALITGASDRGSTATLADSASLVA